MRSSKRIQFNCFIFSFQFFNQIQLFHFFQTSIDGEQIQLKREINSFLDRSQNSIGKTLLFKWLCSKNWKCLPVIPSFNHFSPSLPLKRTKIQIFPFFNFFHLFMFLFQNSTQTNTSVIHNILSVEPFYSKNSRVVRIQFSIIDRNKKGLHSKFWFCEQWMILPISWNYFPIFFNSFSIILLNSSGNGSLSKMTKTQKLTIGIMERETNFVSFSIIREDKYSLQVNICKRENKGRKGEKREKRRKTNPFLSTISTENWQISIQK